MSIMPSKELKVLKYHLDTLEEKIANNFFDSASLTKNNNDSSSNSISILNKFKDLKCEFENLIQMLNRKGKWYSKYLYFLVPINKIYTYGCIKMTFGFRISEQANQS